MTDRPPVPPASPKIPGLPSPDGSGLVGRDETRTIETVVFALVPEFNQVKVLDREGKMYALTPKTLGVDLLALHEGERVVCVVTRKFPRVLSAEILT